MRNLHDEMYVQKVNNFNTALADGKFPASGSFIEAGKFDYLGFLIELGTLDSAITFTLQAADAADGTPADVTGKDQAILTTDDDKWLFIGARASELGVLTPWVTLDVDGSAGSNDYACITFLGWGARHQPVVQLANFVYNIDPLEGV